MTTTFNDHFDFVGYGFYLVCNLVDRLYYGFTFKAHYTTNGWDELTRDPGADDSKSRIKSEWQYDVEFAFSVWLYAPGLGRPVHSFLSLSSFWRHGGVSVLIYSRRNSAFTALGLC